MAEQRDVQALAETVRDYLAPRRPGEHHFHCASRTTAVDGQVLECDCYARASNAAFAALDGLVALLNKQEEARVEGREGMVTVYDHEGVYLGCMGIETWRAALSPPPVASEEKHMSGDSR